MRNNDQQNKEVVSLADCEIRAVLADKRNTRPSTVRDVARMAGVSHATVSRVVNGSGSISHKTRTKVLNAVSSLQYYPNAHAAELGRANGGIARKRVVQADALSTSTRGQRSHPGKVPRVESLGVRQEEP